MDPCQEDSPEFHGRPALGQEPDASTLQSSAGELKELLSTSNAESDGQSSSREAEFATTVSQCSDNTVRHDAEAAAAAAAAASTVSSDAVVEGAPALLHREAAQPVAMATAAAAVSPTGPSKEAASSRGSGRTSASRQMSWRETSVEAREWQTLTLGPFQDSVVCEIMRAWYGVKGNPSLQRDVTKWVLEAWKPMEGLRLWVSNSVFGFDPARLRLKTLCVEYRMANVSECDVSRGNFTEGPSTLTMAPVILSKVLLNIVGATVAASGYAVAKVMTAANRHEDTEIADNKVFQTAFSTWLRLNGIWPSVEYEPCPNGDADDMRQTPIIVCNHMSYIDGFVLAATFGAPKILAMKGTNQTPLVGQMAEDIGVIEVDRADKSSRRATAQAIEEHVRQWTPGQRPMLLFPEGTTSNGDTILPFKKGAFLFGAPVRPAVITYTGSWHPANTNFKANKNGELEPTGDAEWANQFLGHLVHSLQVKVLAPYYPQELEQADARVYANNVHVVMSAAYERLRTEHEQRESWQGTVQRLLGSVNQLTLADGDPCPNSSCDSSSTSSHRAVAMPADAGTSNHRRRTRRTNNKSQQ